ncbi:unnamed protein product, partial [Clonostachys solani]
MDAGLFSTYQDLHCCPICGVRVGPEGERLEDREALWAHKYRALYVDERTGLKLTEECEYIGPRPGRFYHIRPVSDVENAPNETTDALGVGNGPAYNNRRGFVFHAHCWCVLSMANGPSPIPLQRLFDVCSSLPILGNTINWGHDYQGFSRSDDDPNDEWDYRFSGIFPEHGGFTVQLDPIHDSPSEVFNRHPNPAPAWPVRSVSNRRRNSEARDPFSSLPSELVLMIAARMETADVLKMRQATRAFYPLLHEQTFWKSRFGPGSERAWVFSVYDVSQHSWLFNSFSEQERRRWLEHGAWQPGDWRALWRQTRPGKTHPDLMNLKRVWELAEDILSILHLKMGPTKNTDPLPKVASQGYWFNHKGHIQWQIERAMMTGDAYHFSHGCRELYSLHTVVKKSLCRLTFYFVESGASRYLAGIKMTDRSGDEQLMGYESPTAVEFSPYDLGRTFRAFTAAAVPNGIVAVRVHWSTHVSEWLGGEPEGARTWEFSVSRRLRLMKVGFDGFKIVKISVHAQGTVLLAADRQKKERPNWL